MIRVLAIHNPKDLERLMQQIKVDKYGIKIMVPKAVTHLVRVNSVSNIAANILKQEMLSLGGDVAIAREALTGKVRKTDCLIMANVAQFHRLTEKLERQPFGLSCLAGELSEALANYQKANFIIDLGRYKLNLGKRTHIMGIANLTPDSFSGDGLYQFTVCGSQFAVSKIIEFVEKMVEDGADIIDIGAESSRPGARPVSLKEELARVIPVIKALVKKIKVPIAIDTYKPEVARQVLDSGAVIVNDITGLANSKMAKVLAKYKAGLVIMHMRGKPATMQRKPVYKDVVSEVIDFLDRAINRAICAGIKKNKIIIDPGIGFGKTCAHNLEILKRLNEFKVLGRPILVGPSRKAFIGKILNLPAQERIFGTVSSCVLAAKFGAHIVRVHDVKEVKQALKVTDAINGILK
jgi:dihydropteroate synthase